MPRSTSKKKSAPRAHHSVKKIAKELPESPVAPSLAHGYTSYEHTDKHSLTKVDEHNQRLIMWIGISVIMTAIVVVWILSLNNLIGLQTLSAQKDKNDSSLDVETLKAELQDTFSEVRDNMKSLQQLAPTTLSATPATPSSTVTPSVSPAITPSATPNTLPN